jgi:hypothetical protein
MKVEGFWERWVGQGQAINASLVNFQDKKVSEHQMGKQLVHSMMRTS